jgi:hypothetical protein
VRLGELLGLGLELGRAHVLGGGVDEVAHPRDGLRFGQRRIDRLGVLGQEDARRLRAPCPPCNGRSGIARSASRAAPGRARPSASGRCRRAIPPPAWRGTSRQPGRILDSADREHPSPSGAIPTW